MMHDKLTKQNLTKTIAGGALVNSVGIIGKALVPLLFILVARLYGTKIMGIFFLLFTMIDIAVTLTVSGLNDGVMMFSARAHGENEKSEKDFYSILANGFILSLAIAFVIIGLVYLGASNFLFAKYKQPEILHSINFIVWAIPFVIIPILVVSATKALIIMKWDAILLGFLKPLFLILFSFVGWLITPSLNNILIAYLIANICLTFVSLFVFAKCFSFTKLFREIVHFKLSKPLIIFAIPQNLNMTFNTFITNIDIIMLGYFGFKPEIIGFYGMGAHIVKNIRQIKLVFSGVYAPIIAKLYKRGDSAGMNHSFSMVSRWTSTIAFPVAFIIIMYKDELIRIFHNSYTEDTTFMALMLVPPLLSCTLGLSGNILVMTGHSMWNLINSLTVSFINLILNYLLIPRFGFIGAAFATAIASTIVTTMQVSEIYTLVGMKLLITKVYKPYIAILPSIVIAIVTYSVWPADATLVKTIATLFGLATFVLILLILKMEEEDKTIFMPWNREKSEI